MSKKIIILFILLFPFFSGAQNFSGPEDYFKMNPFSTGVGTPKSFMITHSLSQIIDPSNSVSCNNLGIHYRNSYYRVFDLTHEFDIVGDWVVQSVDVGIGIAESGSGVSQPAAIILYVMSSYNNEIIPDSLTMLVDTVFFEVLNSESGFVKSIQIPQFANVVQGKSLVVEVFLPSGQEDGHSLFIGSNEAGETDSTYIKAPQCGINNPTPMNDIMFPDMHLVLNVHGEYADPNPQILTFNIDGQLTETKIVNDPDNQIFTVDIVMPADTSLTALTPLIQIPAGFQISPASGEIVDFSDGPVIYNVNNNFTKISRDWTVLVRNAGPDIVDFAVEDQIGESLIDTLTKTVTAYVPFGTDLTDISPFINVYHDFLIDPPSGTSRDFSSGSLIYTVSHSTLPLAQDWSVSILESENTSINKDLEDFDVCIFPNPACGMIQIQGIDYQNAIIVDCSGRTVKTSYKQTFIDLSDLNQGIYVIRLHTSSGLISKKFIIRK